VIENMVIEVKEKVKITQKILKDLEEEFGIKRGEFVELLRDGSDLVVVRRGSYNLVIYDYFRNGGFHEKEKTNPR